ncbi:hypothetical protein ACPPVT_07500 [Angustibacter sp. McL0619]|uniref:hypothetical protein n=1 Tax=Angustibacter sp. McL0619 TaxID=3415676 RepID=UPI003CEEBB0F
MADLPDATVVLLSAALAPVPFYDGKLPANESDIPLRYVVGYFDDGTPWAGDVAHTSDLCTYRFQLTYATKGSKASRRAVSWLRNTCRAALIDVVPDVDGWQFGPYELDLARPVEPDNDVPSSPALFAVDQFAIYGARA